METNNILSMHRILLLYKQYINLHSKNILITIGAAFFIIIGIHAFFHVQEFGTLHRGSVSNEYHGAIFSFVFFGACLLWVGQAFSGFRSKEKTMEYLMLPASTFEKFLFEFINRIVVFLIVFPIIYWVATNIVTGIFHSQIPEYSDYRFSYSDLFPTWKTRVLLLVASLGMLFFTLPFTGATYFQKLSLVKTILSVALIFGFFTLMILLIVKGFNIKEYSPMDNKILFMKDEKDAQLAGIYAAVLGNLVILAIGYFKLKEKEA